MLQAVHIFFSCGITAAKKEYEYTNHIFGATLSPCIALYALRCSAKDNQKNSPEVFRIDERHIYINDLYISNDDVEKAINIMSSTKTCLSLGCLNLTKWNSNSAAFLQPASRDHLLNTNEASPQIQKVFELPWNAKTVNYLIEKKLFKKFPLDNTMVKQKIISAEFVKVHKQPGVMHQSWTNH